VLQITSNLTTYVSVSSADRKNLHADFNKLTVATPLIYCYVLLFPTVVWGILRWGGLSIPLFRLVSIFGYSLFIYLIVSVSSLRYITV